MPEGAEAAHLSAGWRLLRSVESDVTNVAPGGCSTLLFFPMKPRLTIDQATAPCAVDGFSLESHCGSGHDTTQSILLPTSQEDTIE